MAEAQQLVYLASPAGQGQGGIFLAALDLQSGKIAEPTRVSDGPGSFLAMHPTGKFLYSVAQVRGQPRGLVRAYAIDPKTRGLTLLNEQSSEGGGPCHVNVHPSGKCLIAVNYGEGNFCLLPIAADGKLGPASAVVQHEGKGPNPKRQSEPHPHSVNFAPSAATSAAPREGSGETPKPQGSIALIADLGLDQIKLYDVDASAGKVIAHDPPDAPAPPGAGPRHLAFSPDGKFAYVSDEMTDAVTAYVWDAQRGALREVQTISSLPDDYPPAEADKNTTSEVAVHPNGKFVYIANRGHDSIAVFARDASSGKLTPGGHTSVQGRNPRHFAIDPSGNWMLIANQDSHNVAVLRINPQTGELTPANQSLDMRQPMCVLFVK